MTKWSLIILSLSLSIYLSIYLFLSEFLLSWFGLERLRHHLNVTPLNCLSQVRVIRPYDTLFSGLKGLTLLQVTCALINIHWLSCESALSSFSWVVTGRCNDQFVSRLSRWKVWNWGVSQFSLVDDNVWVRLGEWIYNIVRLPHRHGSGLGCPRALIHD